MAIRRCPYCKAIIDEQDKYCNNCGTQLLFPEDEFVEEEIPGDKIVDDEEAEEEKEEEDLDEEHEIEGELEDEEEALEEEEEESGEEEEETEKETEEKEGEEEKEKVDAKVEEGAEQEEEEEEEEFEPAQGPTSEAGLEEEGDEEQELEAELEDEEEALEVEGEKESGDTGPPPSPPAWKPEPEDSEKKYEVSLEQDELVFKTKELEELTGTVDEGKADLENFLESRREPAAKDTTSDTKDGLPPWASRIRETSPAVEPAGETQKDSKVRREWTTDSGIGVPEKITQAALPFGDTGSREMGTPDEERSGVDEEKEEEAAVQEAARRPTALSLKLRAKVVDWVFVTALWLISLGFTSQVLGVSFFRLIFGSPFPVLAFYVILLVLYFFLFLYFLGETLGDHYFSETD
jgi:hypothetical protein